MPTLPAQPRTHARKQHHHHAPAVDQPRPVLIPPKAHILQRPFTLTPATSGSPSKRHKRISLSRRCFQLLVQVSSKVQLSPPPRAPPLPRFHPLQQASAAAASRLSNAAREQLSPTLWVPAPPRLPPFPVSLSCRCPLTV